MIKSPRECKSILIDPNDLEYKIFTCHKSKSGLKGTAALEYINWGEASEKDESGNELRQFNNRPTCRGRERWWNLEIRRGEFLWWKSIGERYCFFWNPEYVPTDQRNYYLNLTASSLDSLSLVFCLNSTIDRLFIEATAREMTGAYTIIELPVEDVVLKQFICLTIEENEEINSIIKRPISNIQEEVMKPDRQALDSIFFDELKLTQGERDAVYEAVIQLVEARLNKSDSV